MELFLRVFTSCSDDSVSLYLLKRLCNALSECADAIPSNPNRYWKIPEMYEFTFRLMPANMNVFKKIINFSPNGWVHMGSNSDCSSVWNVADGSSFLVPEVQWAELQLYETAP
ncbi:hypothetical protein J2X32_003561 [Rheinheimera pacifica]|uniref:hypothetical protein n=1 Tax=Rheinheimera pacifica TaxID=173990 RepID=UPI002862EBBA|nr:hypothetical protein [Rheinheimera pacifica]MDR6984906.1 hypothetical protein [Rheinheimera pacifica]